LSLQSVSFCITFFTSDERFKSRVNPGDPDASKADHTRIRRVLRRRRNLGQRHTLESKDACNLTVTETLSDGTAGKVELMTDFLNGVIQGDPGFAAGTSHDEINRGSQPVTNVSVVVDVVVNADQTAEVANDGAYTFLPEELSGREQEYWRARVLQTLLAYDRHSAVTLSQRYPLESVRAAGRSGDGALIPAIRSLFEFHCRDFALLECTPGR
jgi:hypothetical protein